MSQRGVSRGELAARMGYQNTSKALRHLDRLMQGGVTLPEFETRLVAALNIDTDQYGAAMEATRELEREEARQRHEAEIAAARAAFRPHLRVIPERRIPRPIFVVAFTGVARWLVEPLPSNVLSMPTVQQLHVVGQIARDHYARKKGDAGPFGAICGYLFRTKFEKAIQMDFDGMVQGQQHGLIPEGHTSLWVGKQRIPPGLLLGRGHDVG